MLNTLRAALEQMARRDVGYRDIFDPDGFSAAIHIARAGGGFVLKAVNHAPIRELHVIPHGGQTIPAEYVPLFRVTDENKLAESIIANNDRSINAIATRIAVSLAEPAHSDRALAYFDMARLIIDANRLRLADQFGPPYRGEPMLNDLDKATMQRIARETALPWFEAIRDLIIENPVAVIFHHHTYDEYGTGEVAHEKGAGERRPAGMFFQKYTSTELAGSRAGEQRQFIDPELLDMLTRSFSGHLTGITDDPRVTVDWPYESPVMLASLLADHAILAGRPAHSAVYETRKDVLVGQKNLDSIIKAIEDMVRITREYSSK